MSSRHGTDGIAGCKEEASTSAHVLLIEPVLFALEANGGRAVDSALGPVVSLQPHVPILSPPFAPGAP